MKEKMKYSPILQFFNICVHILMWGMVLLTIIFWNRIPDVVPQHYGIGGIADSYGSKIILVPMIVVAFFVYLMHLFLMYVMPGLIDGKQLYGENIGQVVTEQETKEGLDIMLRMIALLDLFGIGLCAYISFCIATKRYLGKLFEPILFFGFGIGALYYIVRFLRIRNQVEQLHRGEKQ